ncbi:MAG TPA: Uma2 family endonuclease [Leptospiraceae bacterium]|nr:Uma2 family endonuclease [Leptospiraceae bacterium]HMY66640.1 Uma2 family endonuclease [Leptospiraceae bacterium]HMZ61934.1 Uma2 family endonuclease [Leptospiraceae bacterium]HNI24980.1 Uma2 family endonuclease [Leptospiraceae bacterium]HNI97253.1 Uma2 family endonuclease [Leptospiraceae bacterium]
MITASVQTLENRVPISVEAFHMLYNQGLIPEKAELIEGVIYSKMPKNPIHSNVLRKLNLYLYKALGDQFILSSENPISFDDSEPEPDISVLPLGDYSKFHPKTAILVVEIANTSLSFDTRKASVYAKGAVPEYIIFNLADSKMEVYRSLKESVYTEIRILSKEEFISSVLPNVRFSLQDFL